MKNLVLLLLFIPFISIGQNFDFDDLKEIDSDKKFKKFAFENEFTKVQESAFFLNYAYGYDKDNKLASIWAECYKDTSYYNGCFSFQIAKNTDGSSAFTFNKILEQVKSECTFFDIIESEEKEFFCYTCTDSAYPGKIGFARGSENDYIKIFPNFKFKP